MSRYSPRPVSPRYTADRHRHLLSLLPPWMDRAPGALLRYMLGNESAGDAWRNARPVSRGRKKLDRYLRAA